MGKFIAGEIGEKLAGQAGKKVAAGSVPVIGWIDFAASIINTAATVGPKLKKMNYVLGTTAAVGAFTFYRSYVDEQKGGFTDPEVAKSMAEGLGDTVGDADHIGQTAEMSPMYGALFGAETPQTAANMLFPSAAAAAPNRMYTCDNKEPVASGKLACEEESFVLDNPATTVSDIFNLPGLNVLKGAAGIWTGTISKAANIILEPVVKGLMLLPQFKLIMEKTQEITGELVTELGKKVFKTAMNDNMSGGRTFQVVTAGVDAAAAASGEFALGGAKITQAQSDTLLRAQEEKTAEKFAHASLFARLFDQENPRSLVGRVAMGMPVNASASTNQLATSLTRNPFTVLSSSFASLFTSRVKAAPGLPNAFGVLRSGYAVNDPNLSINPDILTRSYCSEFNKKWADDVKPDDATGMEYHTYTNPCLLDSAVTVAAGGIFSNEALNDVTPTEETAEASPTSSDAPALNVPVSGDNSGMTCQAGTDAGIADGYDDGKLIKIRLCRIRSVTVNASISGNVDRLLNAAWASGVQLKGGGFRSNAGQIQARKNNGCPDIFDAPSKSCRVPTARPGYSNHQMGLAIDFSNCGRSSPCFMWLAGNAAAYGLKNLPSESWHWSVDGK